MIALLAAFALLVAACGAPAPSGVASSPTIGATAAGPPPTSPVVGIVTSVDASGLDKVRGFTLRDATGRSFTFVLGQLENPTEFPPGHLAEHMVTAEPVQVWFRSGNDGLVVYRLGDAGAGASPSAP